MSKILIDEINTSEYGNPLKQFHRDAILDLVLVWGSLDGALTMLVSEITGEELHKAAGRLVKLKGSSKILEIARVLSEHQKSGEVAAKFRKLKKVTRSTPDHGTVSHMVTVPVIC